MEDPQKMLDRFPGKSHQWMIIGGTPMTSETSNGAHHMGDLLRCCLLKAFGRRTNRELENHPFS